MRKLIDFQILLSIILFSGMVSAQQTEIFEDSSAVVSVPQLLDEMEEDQRWSAFLRGKNLLTGIYVLQAGAEDKQQPHETDEVYYVIDGTAKFQSGQIDQVVKTGDVIFVAAHQVHQFYDITKELKLLVFFDQ